MDAARRKAFESAGDARRAIAKYNDAKQAHTDAVQALNDHINNGLPMSGDDIGKMGNVRLKKNVGDPVETRNRVPEGFHLAVGEEPWNPEEHY
jgi:hypothetical protein